MLARSRRARTSAIVRFRLQTVPGDIISDMELAGVIGDPLFEVTFEGGLWDASIWTLSRVRGVSYS